MIRDQFGHPLAERAWRARVEARAEKSRVRMAGRGVATVAQRKRWVSNRSRAAGQLGDAS